MSSAIRAIGRVRYGLMARVFPRRPGRPRCGPPGRRRLRRGGSPDWREIDWRRHLHQIEVDGSQRQLRRHRRGRRAADRVRPRPRRLLAELAREHPARRAEPPRGRDRPAGLRPLGDAARGDLDRGLRPRGGRASASSSGSARSCSSATRWAASSQPRWRSGPGAGRAPGARVRGRHLDHGLDGGPARRGWPRPRWPLGADVPRTRPAPRSSGRGCATSRCRSCRHPTRLAADLL